MVCCVWTRGPFSATPLRVPRIWRMQDYLHYSLFIVLTLIHHILNNTLHNLRAFHYWDHNRSAPPHAKQPLITRKSFSCSHSLKVCIATSMHLSKMFCRDLTSSYVNVTKTVLFNKPIWDFYSFLSNNLDFEYFFWSFFNLADSLLILTPDLHLILIMSIANTISFLKQCLCSHEWG